MSDTPLIKKIIAAAYKKRLARLRRNRTGLAIPWSRPDSRPIEYGLGTGGADIVGYLFGSARVVALEVKEGSGRVQDEQARWLAVIRKDGGFAAVVRSVDDAIAALERARKGESS